MVITKNIEAGTLQNWLIQGKELLLLDIRMDKEREEWMIPHSIHYNVYEKLKAGENGVFDDFKINKNVPIVVICAGGITSLLAADILAKKGYETYSLQGGMKVWNYAWDTSELIFDQFKIIQVRRLAKGCLSYLIGSGKQAMVLDSSLDPSVYEGIAREQGWSIKYVADTHIHADYVSRSSDLAKSTCAKFLMFECAELAYPFTPVKKGQEIQLEKLKIEVLHTPGHTWESTSFLIENKIIFTGDTLFTDGIGRPDLKANEEEAKKKSAALYDSLQKILSLNKNILVLPSHISGSLPPGHKFISASILELEKSIEALSLGKDKFIKSIIARLPESPSNYLTIAEINKSGNLREFLLEDLEAGANRCAIK